MKSIYSYCILLISGFWLTPTPGYSQVPLSSTPSLGKAFIATLTPQAPDIKQDAQLTSGTAHQVLEQITYFDGLGRSVQVINTKGSPTYLDVVRPMAYDRYGRETKKYLPYAGGGTAGSYKPRAIISGAGLYQGSDQFLFYQTGGTVASDEAPYSETVMEASPLNRINKEGATGKDWQPAAAVDRSIKIDYDRNQQNEVMLLHFNEVSQEIVYMNTNLAYYESGTLFVQITKDENNAEVRSYTDKDGRLILKKVEVTSNEGIKTYAETYYIYDVLGNLIVVLPPEGSEIFKELTSPQH